MGKAAIRAQRLHIPKQKKFKQAKPAQTQQRHNPTWPPVGTNAHNHFR